MIDISRFELRARSRMFKNAVGLLGLFLLGVTNAADAQAGPYDDTRTRPGTEITNSIVVTHGDGIAPDPVHAHHDLTVMPFDAAATLRLFRVALDGEESDTILVEDPGRNGMGKTPHPLVETDRILAGVDLFLVLDHAGLNFDSNAVDQVEIVLHDTLTGDREALTLSETGPDTGRFTTSICTCASTAQEDDGQIHTRPHARIDALYQEPWRPDRQIEDSVFVGPIDPYGLLFDSRTGAPLSNVQVTLIDVKTGDPAVVYGSDLRSRYPATLTTGSTLSDASGTQYALEPGEYRFPFVEPGTYRLKIDPPRGYVAPSGVSDDEIQNLSAGPFSLIPGSRLEAFSVDAGVELNIDVPLDGSALIDVRRLGSTDSAMIGDAMKFTVTASTPLRGGFEADILDTLPEGLRIVPGSVRINGMDGEDRTLIGPAGRRITFDDVVIPDGRPAQITYIARVGAAAVEGSTVTSTSTAEALGFMANTASHDLAIESVFHTDSSILLGQVFANGCEASYDPDIDLSGIRLLMENGRFVETDEAGLFSFRNLRPGTHVVAIDPLSLPPGFAPVLCENSTRRAGRAGSVFVDATGGFAEQTFLHIAPSDNIALRSPRTLNEVPSQARVRDLDQKWLDAAPMQTGVVFPGSGYLPRTQSLELAVMRKPGQSVAVDLNGAAIDPIHRRPAMARGDGAGYLDIWNGASLRAGVNDVRVTIRDVRGAVVHEERVEIAFNSEVQKLEYIRDASHPSTDGHRQPYIVLRATDEDGIPLHPGMQVGLSISSPFAFAGARPQDPETRRTLGTVDPDGFVRLHLAPSRLSGTATISAVSGDDIVTAEIYVSAAEREWVIVGLAEGTAAHQEIASHMIPLDAKGIANVGPLEISGRVALYAEGVVDGKWLATLRYDSGVDADAHDYFAVDPSAQYIVYGDQSIEGDGAQSRHPLYLRLSSEDADILYGDFDTDLDHGVAEYSRRLTGAQISWREERMQARTFAARTAQSFLSESFPANGTSGPFSLQGEDILPFSERVHVETMHRADSDRLKDERTLVRGTDYDIDYRTGRIFLAEPLRARDSELDPNYLVVEYEVETSHADGLILGGRLDYEVDEAWSIGATVVQQDHIAGSDGTGHLFGIDTAKDLGRGWTAHAGLAFSHQDSSNTLPDSAWGHAAELSFMRSTASSQIELYMRSETTDFGIENQDVTATHVVSAGMTGDVTLSQATRENDAGDTERTTRRVEVAGDIEHDLDRDRRALSFEGLLRHDANAATGFTSHGYGLRVAHEDRPAGGDRASGTALKALGFSEWTSGDERLNLQIGQEITLADEGQITSADTGSIEARYALSDAITIKASNEIAWTTDDHADIFALGAEITPWHGASFDLGATHATDGIDGATIGHAGLDQEVSLTEAWTLRGGLEHQSQMGGEQTPVALAGLSHERIGEGFTALTMGLDRHAETWRIGGGFEHRLGEIEDTTRLYALGNGELRADLAFGMKASFLAGHLHESDEQTREDKVEASLAWRPKDARFALLDQINARREIAAGGDSLSLTHSTYYTRQLDEGHELNLRHAIKYARQRFDGEDYDDVLTLLGAEYRHDLSDWLDAGVHGSVMQSLSTGTTDGSAGLSVGLTPFENGWLSMGYNFAGFHDEDFSALGYTDKGAFLQFRFKIDRETFAKPFGG